jgi:hypothetical protein
VIDEIKLRHDAARASKAKTLAEDELLVEGFGALEAAYNEAWRTSHVSDTAGREKLFIAINVVGKVRQHLEAIMANGKLAKAELENLTKEAERKSLFGRRS